MVSSLFKVNYVPTVNISLKTPEISQLSQVSNFPAQQTGSVDSFVSLKKAIRAFSMLESGKQFHRLVELRALSTGDVHGWQEALPTRFLGQHHQQMITRHTEPAASGDGLLTKRRHYLKNLMTATTTTKK